MNYSSSRHKSFAIHLNRYHSINEQEVLDHPENYLGPNYKEVLNCWFYWDSLSIEQKGVYWGRYWDLDGKTRNRAIATAKELASEVIDPRFMLSLWEVPLEIIAAHLYIERGIPFTYLPHLITIDSA